MANYDAHYYKCGCWIRDTCSYSVKITWTKCKKHQKDFKQISWLSWAKKHAPAQYKQYKKDMR
jgi:hypothetical protein